MPSLKWRYDRELKEWAGYTPNCNKCFTIHKSDKWWHLHDDWGRDIAPFRLLKNAKRVAELIEEG